MNRLVLEERFDNGEVTIRVYQVAFDEFVVADQAGWLNGVFASSELALTHGKKANKLV